MSCRRSGKVRTSKSWTRELRLGDPELARRLAHLARERVGREARRQRAGRDREGVVVHLHSRLDEPRHRAAAAELAVVGVRRQHEHALPGLDHATSGSVAAVGADERDQAEQRPHGRVLEERVVEEAVHGDRAKRKRRDECRASCSRSAPAAERGRERRHAEPAEQHEPEHAGLGDHRHGRRVGGRLLRLLALEAGLLRIGALEAARADAEDGVVDGDPEPVADEPRTVARDRVEPGTRLLQQLVPHLRRREADRDEHDRERGQRRGRAPAPDHRSRGDRAGDERGEARLREREQEAEPDRRDRSDPGRQQPVAHAEQDERQRREDRDDEVAAVDRRVPEDRVDAEERRVGVVDLQLRVPEHLARGPLVEADPGIRERGRDEGAVEGEQGAPVEGQPRDADREQAERQHEGGEEDRALAEVVRPEQREPRPRDDRGERPGERPELAAALVPAQELPAERERERADRRRRAAGAGSRPHCRCRPGSGSGCTQAWRTGAPTATAAGSTRRPRRRRDRPRPPPTSSSGATVRSEVEAEQADARRPGDEAGEPELASRRDEQQRETEAAERAGKAGELGQRRGSRTNTAARAVCPLAETVSVNRPFCSGARSRSVPGRAKPLRPPSVQRTALRVGGDADRERRPRGGGDPVAPERDVANRDGDRRRPRTTGSRPDRRRPAAAGRRPGATGRPRIFPFQTIVSSVRGNSVSSPRRFPLTKSAPRPGSFSR